MKSSACYFWGTFFMVLPSHSLSFFVVDLLTRLPCICQLFVLRFTRQFLAHSFLPFFVNILFLNKLFFFLQVTWWGCCFLVCLFFFMLRQFCIEFLYSPQSHAPSTKHSISHSLFSSPHPLDYSLP